MVLLGFSSNLPNQLNYHQNVDSSPIPSSLLNNAPYAPGLQPTHRLPGRIRNLDNRQCLGQLCAHRQILGSHNCRILLRQGSPLVLELGYSHSHRSVDLDLPHACDSIASTSEQTEIRSHGCLCAWWIVCFTLSYYIPTSISLTYTSVMITSILRLKSLLVISNSSDPTRKSTHSTTDIPI